MVSSSYLPLTNNNFISNSSTKKKEKSYNNKSVTSQPSNYKELNFSPHPPDEKSYENYLVDSTESNKKKDERLKDRANNYNFFDDDSKNIQEEEDNEFNMLANMLETKEEKDDKRKTLIEEHNDLKRKYSELSNNAKQFKDKHEEHVKNIKETLESEKRILRDQYKTIIKGIINRKTQLKLQKNIEINDFKKEFNEKLNELYEKINNQIDSLVDKYNDTIKNDFKIYEIVINKLKLYIKNIQIILVKNNYSTLDFKNYLYLSENNISQEIINYYKILNIDLIKIVNSDKINSNSTYKLEFNLDFNILKNLSLIKNKILKNIKNKLKNNNLLKKFKNYLENVNTQTEYILNNLNDNTIKNFCETFSLKISQQNNYNKIFNNSQILNIFTSEFKHILNYLYSIDKCEYELNNIRIDNSIVKSKLNDKTHLNSIKNYFNNVISLSDSEECDINLDEKKTSKKWFEKCIKLLLFSKKLIILSNEFKEELDDYIDKFKIKKLKEYELNLEHEEFLLKSNIKETKELDSLKINDSPEEEIEENKEDEEDEEDENKNVFKNFFKNFKLFGGNNKYYLSNEEFLTNLYLDENSEELNEFIKTIEEDFILDFNFDKKKIFSGILRLYHLYKKNTILDENVIESISDIIEFVDDRFNRMNKDFENDFNNELKKLDELTVNKSIKELLEKYINQLDFNINLCKNKNYNDLILNESIFNKYSFTILKCLNVDKNDEITDILDKISKDDNSHLIQYLIFKLFSYPFVVKKLLKLDEKIINIDVNNELSNLFNENIDFNFFKITNFEEDFKVIIMLEKYIKNFKFEKYEDHRLQNYNIDEKLYKIESEEELNKILNETDPDEIDSLNDEFADNLIVKEKNIFDNVGDGFNYIGSFASSLFGKEKETDLNIDEDGAKIIEASNIVISQEALDEEEKIEKELEEKKMEIELEKEKEKEISQEKLIKKKQEEKIKFEQKEAEYKKNKIDKEKESKESKEEDIKELKEEEKITQDEIKKLQLKKDINSKITNINKAFEKYDKFKIKNNLLNLENLNNNELQKYDEKLDLILKINDLADEILKYEKGFFYSNKDFNKNLPKQINIKYTNFNTNNNTSNNQNFINIKNDINKNLNKKKKDYDNKLKEIKAKILLQKKLDEKNDIKNKWYSEINENSTSEFIINLIYQKNSSLSEVDSSLLKRINTELARIKTSANFIREIDPISQLDINEKKNIIELFCVFNEKNEGPNVC